MASGRPDWQIITSPLKSIYGHNLDPWYKYSAYLLTDNAWHTVFTHTVPASTILHIGQIILATTTDTPFQISFSIASDTLFRTVFYHHHNIKFSSNTIPTAAAGATIEIEAQHPFPHNAEIYATMLGLKQTIKE